MAQSSFKINVFAIDFHHTLIDDDTDTFILKITDVLNLELTLNHGEILIRVWKGRSV